MLSYPVESDIIAASRSKLAAAANFKVMGRRKQ
jgi:hypothetical protein